MTDSKLLVLSSAEVDSLIEKHLSVEQILESQVSVFKALHERRDGIANPLRIAMGMPNHTGLFMPGRVGEHTTCKIVCVPTAASKQRGLPASTTLFDGQTGRTRAIVNAAKLTALRTAAGSMLSMLALEVLRTGRSQDDQDISHIALFGAGLQAVFHAWLLVQLAQRRNGGHSTKVQLDFVVRRESEAKLELDIRENLAWLRGQVKELDVNVNVLSQSGSDKTEVEVAVRRAEIIVCAVPSTSPLFPSAWVSSGTHVILIGAYKPHMQEVEPELVHRARAALIVDDVDACSHEAGDLIQANIESKECISLGALLSHPSFSKCVSLSATASKASGTRDDVLRALNELRGDSGSIDAPQGNEVRDISLFKSVGVGLQDVAITSLVIETAEKLGNIGTWVNF